MIDVKANIEAGLENPEYLQAAKIELLERGVRALREFAPPERLDEAFARLYGLSDLIFISN